MVRIAAAAKSVADAPGHKQIRISFRSLPGESGQQGRFAAARLPLDKDQFSLPPDCLLQRLSQPGQFCQTADKYRPPALRSFTLRQK